MLAAPAVSGRWTQGCAHEYRYSRSIHFPQWPYGLSALSPGDSSCHRARQLTVIEARLGSNNLRRVDTSHGRQDHTVLPYAASSPNFGQTRAAGRRLARRLSAVRLRAVLAQENPALQTLLAPDAAASTATRPNL